MLDEKLLIVRISRPMRATLLQRAQAEGLTLSELTRVLLRDALRAQNFWPPTPHPTPEAEHDHAR